MRLFQHTKLFNYRLLASDNFRFLFRKTENKLTTGLLSEKATMATIYLSGGLFLYN
jgi:hypothetical protein